MYFSILLFCAGIFEVTPSARDNKRIIGGVDAKRHEFPYIASINVDARHICGCSIISPTWLISAAHCFLLFIDFFDPNTEVIAGMLNQNETHPDLQKIRVAEVKLSDDFSVDETTNNIQSDIALLRLESPLKFTKAVQPVALPKLNQEFTGRALLSGWGTFKQPKVKPVTLQCLEMDIITREECQKIREELEVSPDFKIVNSMVCTIAADKASSACHGDSGGPLVQNGVLIGIVSFGDDRCGEDVEQVTNVLTRVSSYIDFIKTNVKDLP